MSDVNIRGVIQIGANVGQECKRWRSQGIQNQIYFEPVYEAFNQLLSNAVDPNYNVHCYRIAVSNRIGEFPFNVGVEHGFSSFHLPEPNRPPEQARLAYLPAILVPTVTLDRFFETHEEVDVKDYNYLFLDAEGGELNILKGADEILKNIDLISAEVSYKPIFIGAPLFDDLNEYILSNNFRLIDHRPGNPNQGEATWERI